jgi:aminobenzoyl-glutamate utilization protein B
MAEQVGRVLDHNAQCAARAAHCSWRRTWVSKSRPGLANHVLAEATYRNIVLAGPPRFEGEAIRLAQAIQAELGLEPMAKPYSPVAESTISPQEAEAVLRQDMPPSQLNMTSDDYTEYCWHCPTVRFYIGRPMLEAPPGFAYPAWAMNALGGLRPCIDPMIRTAAKVVGATVVDLMSDADLLGRARQEWQERTGGIGGSRWIAPLLPSDFRVPNDFRWPEYISTARGAEWWIPTRSGDPQ